jgi:hypothetical protein
MRCQALVIWVGFFKQSALPGEALQKIILQKNKKIKIINKKSQMNEK